MRRWIVGMLGIGMLLVGGASQASAHGGPFGPAGYGRAYGGHHTNWRGYGAPRVGYGYGGYGGCGPQSVAAPYPYGVGYGGYGGYGYGAYPAAGLGLATRNFSFWVQP